MSRHRIADMQLRGNTSPGPVRVYWPSQPASHQVPLLVFCIVGAGAETACRILSEDAGLVVLAVRCDLAGVHDGLNVLAWAADHAAELGADPARLLVGGEGAGATVAAAVAREAHAQRWPPVVYAGELRELRRFLAAGRDEYPRAPSSD
jgi:acetyl esterase